MAAARKSAGSHRSRIAMIQILKKIFKWFRGERIRDYNDESWLERRLAGKPSKPKIYKIIRKCPGGLHSWVESSAGVIRKENKNIPKYLFV